MHYDCDEDNPYLRLEALVAMQPLAPADPEDDDQTPEGLSYEDTRALQEWRGLRAITAFEAAARKRADQTLYKHDRKPGELLARVGYCRKNRRNGVTVRLDLPTWSDKGPTLWMHLHPQSSLVGPLLAAVGGPLRVKTKGRTLPLSPGWTNHAGIELLHDRLKVLGIEKDGTLELMLEKKSGTVEE
jgi:hypothetical protein